MPEASSASGPGGRQLSIEVFSHVGDGIGSDEVERLQQLAHEALMPCLAAPAKDDVVPLADLSEVEVSVISDEAIATVHAQFMDDPTPTDVITFHHGEILISVDTAKRCADELDQPVLRELLLYVIHGLLHLNGHDDRQPAARKRMHAIQDAILERLWPLPEASIG